MKKEKFYERLAAHKPRSCERDCKVTRVLLQESCWEVSGQIVSFSFAKNERKWIFISKAGEKTVLEQVTKFHELSRFEPDFVNDERIDQAILGKARVEVKVSAFEK